MTSTTENEQLIEIEQERQRGWKKQLRITIRRQTALYKPRSWFLYNLNTPMRLLRIIRFYVHFFDKSKYCYICYYDYYDINGYVLDSPTKL